MLILVTFFRGVSNFGFNPFRRNQGRPVYGGLPRQVVGNNIFSPINFGPFGGARQVYGPGVFARSPFTKNPVGYFPFGNYNGNSPLQRRFGIGTTRQLVNNLNFRYGVRPLTYNISDSFFGFTNNLERNLARSVRLSAPVNIWDSMNTDSFTNNLYAQTMRNYSSGNIMDRINSMVDTYLMSQGIAPSFSSSFSSSSGHMSFATDNTAFMIIVKPIKISDLGALRDSVISSA